MASRLESFSKWLQLKIYQLEVHLSVYIFTPIEKFFFYSILFLLFSLTFIATVLYLPQHLQFVLTRAWFYINGDAHESAAAEVLKGVLASAGRVAEATREAVKEL
ncbi:hypothetical protein BT67DRAFT_370125 [Trichocladium antarcticum]|uniref:Uncharacterized protein n=1 Tax=Trichocladium antarcticum TaxID=1450529 RepID=A0AAN6UTQ7_9PEZI|nr:hypothetical protein BT67DRAFT_370125 [Trichocladium antarcticum]